MLDKIKLIKPLTWVIASVIFALVLVVVILGISLAAKPAPPATGGMDEFTEVIKTYTDTLHNRSMRRQEEMYRKVSGIEEDLKVLYTEFKEDKTKLYKSIGDIAKIKSEYEKPINYIDSSIRNIIDRLRSE